MKDIIKKFAENVLVQEGLTNWSVEPMSGGIGHCARKEKKIYLGVNVTRGIVLHEVAHALDKNPPTKDGHWGYHADLMHGLFDKTLTSLIKSKRQEERDRIGKKLLKMENEKWGDAEHCSCLGYAISTIFGEKYEELMKLHKKDI